MDFDFAPSPTPLPSTGINDNVVVIWNRLGIKIEYTMVWKCPKQPRNSWTTKKLLGRNFIIPGTRQQQLLLWIEAEWLWENVNLSIDIGRLVVVCFSCLFNSNYSRSRSSKSEGNANQCLMLLLLFLLMSNNFARKKKWCISRSVHILGFGKTNSNAKYFGVIMV